MLESTRCSQTPEGSSPLLTYLFLCSSGRSVVARTIIYSYFTIRPKCVRNDPIHSPSFIIPSTRPLDNTRITNIHSWNIKGAFPLQETHLRPQQEDTVTATLFYHAREDPDLRLLSFDKSCQGRCRGCLPVRTQTQISTGLLRARLHGSSVTQIANIQCLQPRNGPEFSRRIPVKPWGRR
ncbi:hypothetical protein B0H13DRAFT_596295 [Mycena leptocephala]|nr:hypothetical protein B0H13DRAFT_596295 [Mycena leptocephala]